VGVGAGEGGSGITANSILGSNTPIRTFESLGLLVNGKVLENRRLLSVIDWAASVSLGATRVITARNLLICARGFVLLLLSPVTIPQVEAGAQTGSGVVGVDENNGLLVTSRDLGGLENSIDHSRFKREHSTECSTGLTETTRSP